MKHSFRKQISLVTVLGMLMTGCVLKSEHDVTIKDNVNMAESLKTVTKERDQLRTQLEESQKTASDLEARNEELSVTNQNLASKNSDYSRMSVEAQQELLKLKQEKVQTERKIEYVTQTYDDLVKTLKDEIADGRVAVAEKGNRLSVNVADRVLFPSGSTKIEAGGKKVLQKISKVLANAKDKQIDVEGHTDNVPISGTLRSRFGSNWELSAARAVTVVRYLEDLGVDPSRLSAVGLGEHRPIAGNDSADGRRRNRRIEIALVPLRDGSPSPKSRN